MCGIFVITLQKVLKVQIFKIPKKRGPDDKKVLKKNLHSAQQDCQ